MDKFIKVIWIKEDDYGFDTAMKVIESNHPRFVKGSRFDFGFFKIATRQGYTIHSEPSAEVIKKDDAK